MESYEVVIIGAGQAGLSMGYYLKKEGLPFVILDGSEKVGDSWRKRYQSLVLFTPRRYNSLPGLPLSGEPEGFPAKDEIAEYFLQYASHFKLPVKSNVQVQSLTKKNETFHMITNQGEFTAGTVIVATGSFQKPYIPQVVESPDNQPFQLHSSRYNSPQDIMGDSVLVVGGGNSGAQIAVELAGEKQVTIAVSHRFKFLPLRILGRSIFNWLETLGLLFAGVDTSKGKWFRKQPDPIFGKELKAYLNRGKVKLKPRVIKVFGSTVTFSDDTHQDFDSIIWSTGFIPAYDWINIEGVLGADGKPNHKRGITKVRGLYFLGLPWQYTRGSGLLYGVGRDAEYLMENLSKK
ncbi:NAD(P)-binding domain-containing protein [Bacillus sp. RO1]|uniref:flavin-containing monooxygenase n=1 Tax=Bacillus sp. RO1 TaxID=2722703 RepID=UPI0014567249|nr:NAD(P)-binding domain-containing protein [Bacillus sp. RO1]NLP52578.1 NAD(P)-binding domain-containing protein [Bacillus sp. RO1]